MIFINHVIEAQKVKAIGKLENVGANSEKMSSADKLRVLNLDGAHQNQMAIEKPQAYDNRSYVGPMEKGLLSMRTEN